MRMRVLLLTKAIVLITKYYFDVKNVYVNTKLSGEGNE